MTEGNGAHQVPSYDEVERAIRSVPGVAEASIVRSRDTGRGRLRIRLHPGEDAERVSWSVAATMRERFGIALDPEEIRPRVTEATEPAPGEPEGPVSEDVIAEPEDLGTAPSGPSEDLGPAPHEERPDRGPPATGPEDAGRGAQAVADPAVVRDEPLLVTTSVGPSEGGAPVVGAALSDDAGPDRSPWRPTIRDLNSRNDGTAVTVTARLELDGRVVAGDAAGAPTARGLRRAIADATVRAVGSLTRSPLRAQVDRVSVDGSDPTSVSVVVSLLSGRGEELLLGAAIVRDDVEHAIMRATLDALNRRVEPELVG